VLNPLLLMLTYFFVFGVVLNSRFRDDPSRSGFFLYYIAGVLPWLAFSEAIGRAPYTMLEHRGFIKKLVFPVEILPVNLVMSGLVTEFFGVILFALALLLFRGHVPATAFYLPFLLIPQILFTAGVCWFLSALGVFVRDLAPISGFVITIWFFITPICYDERALVSLAPQFRQLLTKNPMYVLVAGYRSIFLESKAPDWAALAWLSAASVAVFLLGHAWFYKLRKSFADLI
jgi:lipopolysaccharide transport system permease protein